MCPVLLSSAVMEHLRGDTEMRPAERRENRFDSHSQE